MGADQHFDWRETAASTLEWWRDAGVDMLVDELPRDWLAAPLRPAAPVAEPTPAVIPSLTALPDTLAAFIAWRDGADAPEAAWHGPTLVASGPADAAVMILVDCPDRDDGPAGVLMTGATGRLFDRMLAAIGLTRDDVHLAAVCARRPSAGRIGRDIEDRLAELARHHVGLVAPKRLLLLGNAASRAILGIELAESRGRLHAFNHKGGETGVVATFHPRFLIEKPVAKAGAWDDLRMVMGGLA